MRIFPTKDCKKIISSLFRQIKNFSCIYVYSYNGFNFFRGLLVLLRLTYLPPPSQKTSARNIEWKNNRQSQKFEKISYPYLSFCSAWTPFQQIQLQNKQCLICHLIKYTNLCLQGSSNTVALLSKHKLHESSKILRFCICLNCIYLKERNFNMEWIKIPTKLENKNRKLTLTSVKQFFRFQIDNHDRWMSKILYQRGGIWRAYAQNWTDSVEMS